MSRSLTILSIFAISVLLAMNVQTKELVCTTPGKTSSGLVIYQVVPGKKGARGVKGLRGDPSEITEKDLQNLECKK